MFSLPSLLRYMGVRGSIRSVADSVRKRSAILSTAEVITSISRSGTVSGSPIVLGYTGAHESHPLQSRTFFAIGPGGHLSIVGNNGVLVGPGSVIRIDGTVELGDCFINFDSKLICEEEIVIGDGTSISWNVTILDSNRHDLVKPSGKSTKTEPILIGDDVLIGHSTTVSKGVSIGDGSVVAAGSVVIDDVPPNKIVAGNPATVIDDVERWD